MDELQLRQNEFLLQLQGIYALHCSFAILFFYYFIFFFAPLSLPFFFILFCSSLPWLSKLYLSEETKPKPHRRRSGD
jgi:hypothetical protein